MTTLLTEPTATATPTVVTPTEPTVTWSPEGRQTWKAMAYHVAALRTAYGRHNDWTMDAALSLAHASTHLASWSQLRVMKDGPLSLYCVGDSIHFGILFSSVHRRCLATDTGCKAVINDDGVAWSYMPGDVVEHTHVLSYPLDAPKPGTWSFHS